MKGAGGERELQQGETVGGIGHKQGAGEKEAEEETAKS